MIKALRFSLIFAALDFGADEGDALFKDARTRLNAFSRTGLRTNAGGQKALAPSDRRTKRN